MSNKQYAERNAMELDEAGNYYCRHIAAMTGEGLHSKSDIAAELGWRDMQIAKLNEQVQALAAESYRDGLIISRIGDALNHGLFGAAISIVSEVNTKPATDTILNEVRAQGADNFAAEMYRVANEHVANGRSKKCVVQCRAAAKSAEDYAAAIRKGEQP